MSEHRVSVLSASLSRYVDPARSRDPQIRAVVAQLKTLPVAPPPRAHFRAELRAQLVAVAPRLISEGVAVERPMVDIVPRPSAIARATHAAAAGRHTDSHSWLARLARIRIGRPVAVAASVVAAFALLLGGAVLMSKKALPGDTLYGLKRASERVEYATAGSDQEKAGYLLDFAATRANEVQALLSRSATTAAGSGAQAGGGVNSHTANLITSTLASADSDVKSASKLLGGQAVHSASASPLSAMTKWAPAQLRRLQKIAAAMPAGPLRARADSSAHLVTAALTRAQTLQGKVDCSCMSGAPTDELGPVPCTVCQPVSVATPGKSGSQPAKHPHGKPSVSQSIVATVTEPATVSPRSFPPAVGPTPTPSSPGQVLPSLPIPLPTSGVPSLPLTVSSCGASLSLGPIHVGLGLCTPGVHASLHP